MCFLSKNGSIFVLILCDSANVKIEVIILAQNNSFRCIFRQFFCIIRTIVPNIPSSFAYSFEQHEWNQESVLNNDFLVFVVNFA